VFGEKDFEDKAADKVKDWADRGANAVGRAREEAPAEEAGGGVRPGRRPGGGSPAAGAADPGGAGGRGGQRAGGPGRAARTAGAGERRGAVRLAR